MGPKATKYLPHLFKIQNWQSFLTRTYPVTSEQSSDLTWHRISLYLWLLDETQKILAYEQGIPDANCKSYFSADHRLHPCKSWVVNVTFR